jgi:CheY-like chemotaxis protein
MPMFEKEIPVLLVDDDPDVLAVSKLAMRSFEVFGLPITVYTATSKAEAIDLLTSRFALQAQVGAKLNVAFLDVVMETDTAGLELADYIRNTLGNKFTQIYVRTGQPGIAPERSVIDKYDIDGYFTKAEATEDKLYTLVKSGVRHAYFTGLSLALSNVLAGLITASGSRDALRETLTRSWGMWDVDFRIGYSINGETILRGFDEAEFGELRDALDGEAGTPIGRSGNDKYVIDGNRLLIKVAGSDTTDEVYDVAVGHAPAPEMLIPVMHTFVRSFAALWKKAGERELEPVGA